MKVKDTMNYFEIADLIVVDYNTLKDSSIMFIFDFAKDNNGDYLKLFILAKYSKVLNDSVNLFADKNRILKLNRWLVS